MKPLKEDLDFLEHFGVKGMKWGVRRSPDQLGSKKPYSQHKKSNLNKNIVKGLRIATVALAGAAVVASIRSNKTVAKSNMNAIRSSPMTNLGKNYAQRNKPTFSAIPMGPIGSTGKSSVAQAVKKSSGSNATKVMKSVTENRNSWAKSENTRLLKWYNDFNVPMAQREYVDLWT